MIAGKIGIWDDRFTFLNIYNSVLMLPRMDLEQLSARIKGKFMVTISGNPGSGKSSAAEIFASLTGAKRIYVGGIRRQMAQDKGMTIEQLNEYAITHPETDVDIDRIVASQVRDLFAQGRRVLVEGRTQFHFLPESLKIYIFVDPMEGARRIYEDHRNGGKNRNECVVTSLTEMLEAVKRREESDAARYLQYYGFDHRDKGHYNSVIDSTNLSKDEVVARILELVYDSNNKI